MSTCEAVVLSGRVFRPVTVLVIDFVRVDTAAVVWLESEEKKSGALLLLLLLFPLVGGVPFNIPPIRLHAPE